jgi:hypothetical protein
MLDELKAVKDAMPRERLEAMVVDPKTSPSWAARCALMLGVCGNENSANLLRGQIMDEWMTARYRHKFGEFLLAHLLLEREEGLKFVSDHIIRNERTNVNRIISTLWALERLWDDSRSPHERAKICEVVYPLLDDKDNTDPAIESLTHMQDWSLQPRLAAMYKEADRFDAPQLLRDDIVKYMKACFYSAKPDAVEDPKYIKDARDFLRSLPAQY